MLALSLVLVASPVYRLAPEIDAPIIATALVLNAGWLIGGTLGGAYCAPRCDPEGLLFLDAPVAGRWSRPWGHASDAAAATLALGAYASLAAFEGFGEGLSDLVVVVEAALIANALSVLTTAAVGRPRPFLYGEEAPLEARNGGNGRLSFFSGHSATSFALAVATAETLRRGGASGLAYWLTLAGGLTAASFVASARVLAGQHFPTDVLAGALVGASMGILIPAVHPRGEAGVALAPSPGGLGLLARW